jgi:ribosome maturation factor RimP
MDEELLIALQPVVESVGLELVDVERRGGVLLVTVDRSGGVDLEALTDANRALSRALDEIDPIPGRYSLEVSSPGLERPLRRPAHFARAVGEMITVKTRPQVPGDRRRSGRLVAADDEGFDLAPEAAEGGAEDPEAAVGPVRLAYSDIDRARTLFEWGPATAPGRGAPARRSAGGREARGEQKKEKKEQRGKQVVNR